MNFKIACIFFPFFLCWIITLRSDAIKVFWCDIASDIFTSKDWTIKALNSWVFLAYWFCQCFKILENQFIYTNQFRNFIISEENESLQRDGSSCETCRWICREHEVLQKQVEKAGAEVTVVNTLKFKVIMNLWRRPTSTMRQLCQSPSKSTNCRNAIFAAREQRTCADS